MKALIVEDELIAAKRLQNLVNELAPEIELVGHVSSVKSAMSWFQVNTMPDLIFLDIQLNDGYGFDVLDQLEEYCPVIFTTAYNEYAIRGFKYNGIDYLLKPIDKRELNTTLAKFKKSIVNKEGFSEISALQNFKNLLEKEYKKRFMIKIGNQFKAIKVEEIAYFKSEEGGIILVNSMNKKFPVEYSLDQLEEILDPFIFFRINRKYLVTVDAVKEIHTYFNSRLLLKMLPTPKEEVIVSRERVTKFKEWLDI